MPKERALVNNYRGVARASLSKRTFGVGGTALNSMKVCTYEPTWPASVLGRSGKRKDAAEFDSPLRLIFLFKIVIYGHCLVTFPCTINKTLKWLRSLPILVRK